MTVCHSRIAMKKILIVSVVLSLISTGISASGEGQIFIRECEGDKIKVRKIGEDFAYLGIYMDQLNRRWKEKYGYPQETGVVITGIMDDSPADQAGLKEGDIIFKFQDREVEEPSHLADLVRDKEPGGRVGIIFYREGKKKEVKVELGKRSSHSMVMDLDDYYRYYDKAGKYLDQWRESIDRKFGGWRLGSMLGLKVTDLNSDLGGYFEVEGNDGVLVVEVEENSAADKAGFKAGDIIVEAGGEDIEDVEELIEVVKDVDKDEQIEVTVIRHRDREKIKVAPECGYLGKLQDLDRMHPRKMQDIEIIEKVDKGKMKKVLERLEEKLERMEERLRKLEEKNDR